MKHNNIESKQDKKVPYQAPKIIYEGQISTRAGSPVGETDKHGVDPANLFGND